MRLTLALSTALMAVTLLPPASFAKTLTAPELRELQGKMQQSDALTLDFTQSSYTALRGKTRQRRGQAQLSKTGKFKWMLETPVKEYKIYDGSNFYDYSPDTHSAVRYAKAGEHATELKQIVDLVLNFDSLLEKYDLVKAETFDESVHVQLRPKNPATDLVQVELILDLKKSYISSLKFDLKNKNTLTHEFSRPVREALPPSAFVLPDGVKITDSL